MKGPARAARRGRAHQIGAALAAFGAALALAPLAHAAESLVLVPDPLRTLVSFIALLALIYPVQRLLLQPLAQVLEQRSLRTSGALERAERENQQARELEVALQAKLAGARAQAQSERAALLAEAERAERSALAHAREEAAQLIEGIRTRVREESTRARADLPAMAGELAREAASVLLGRPL